MRVITCGLLSLLLIAGCGSSEEQMPAWVAEREAAEAETDDGATEEVATDDAEPARPPVSWDQFDPKPAPAPAPAPVDPPVAGGPPPAGPEPAGPEPAGPEPAAGPAPGPVTDLEAAIKAQDVEIDAGRTATLLDRCRRRITAHPRDASAHYLLGRALGVDKQLEPARLAFEQAIKLDPKHAWAHFGMGGYYLISEQVDPATKSFEKALALAPNSHAFMVNLAKVYHLSGRTEKGLALLDKAIEAQPRNVDYIAARAYMLGHLKRNPEAIAAMTEALKLEPARFSSLWLLAQLHEASNQLDKALATYRLILDRVQEPRLLERTRAAIGRVEALVHRLQLNAVRQADGLEELKAHLNSPDVTVRRAAYRVLAARLKPGSLPLLFGGLADADALCRVTCVRGLTVQGKADGETVPVLLRLLRLDSSPEVRGAITSALAELGDRAVIPQLARLLKSEKSEYVLEQLVVAMKKLAKSSGPGLDLDWDELEKSKIQVADAWLRWARQKP